MTPRGHPYNNLLRGSRYESDGVTSRLHEQFGYAYDAAWNLHYRTNNALTETFGANAANELTNISRSGTMTVAGSVGSAYGPISVTASGTGLSSGAASVYGDATWARAGASPVSGQNSYTATATDGYNRTSQDSVTVTLLGTNNYIYDANGNLLSDGQRTFAYDDENQLSSVTISNAWRSEFVYDGMLRRRKRLEYTWSGGAWLKTNEVHYVYDGRLVVQERDANNLPQVSYTRGNDLSGEPQGGGGIGGLLARTDSSLLALGSSLAHAYYHCDGNGNVTCLINASNAVVARYSYDPFGNVLSMSGPLAGANVYRFSSKEVHSNSGLVYYLYRCYDPNLQRWVNRDPIGEIGGTNLFAFAGNAPLGRADPFGLADCGDWGGDWWPNPSGPYPNLGKREYLGQRPPVRIMPNTGLVNPASPSGSPQAAMGGLPALFATEYDDAAGAPLGFTVKQIMDLLYPNPPPRCQFGCPAGQCPGHITAPLPPPPPPRLPPLPPPPGYGCSTCHLNGPDV